MDKSLDLLFQHMSDRRLRLFACACARHVFALIEEKWPLWVADVAERFAEGRASRHELTVARDAAFARLAEAHRDVVWIASRGHAGLGGPHVRSAAWCAARGTALSAAAALAAAGESPRDGARVAARVVARAGPRHVLPDLLSDVAGPEKGLPGNDWPDRVVSLAGLCYRGHSFHRLLAEALDELGEAEAAAHCRRPLHVKGCWVVDHILDKK
jgi:hypothetical protein